MQKKVLIRICGLLTTTMLFLGCNRESDLIGAGNTELDARVPDNTAVCERCPNLQSFSFSYLDETRSSLESGHFLLGFSLENDLTQYGAVPVEIDLFDYMQEDDSFKSLNDDPFFQMFIEQLGVSADTLKNLQALTNYSATAQQKIQDGFYNNQSNFCIDRQDQGLYNFTQVAVEQNELGDLIAPDSALICLAANDVCAMRSVVDLMTFSLYPYEQADQTAANPYDKTNFRYEDPFAVLNFDNRNLVADVDFGEIEGINTSLMLGECPIFRSNDRTVPVEFKMEYDKESSELVVFADWADGKPLYRVNVILAVGELALTGIRLARDIVDNEGLQDGVSVELPELFEILENENEVLVFLQIASQEAEDTDDTVNSVIFELTKGSCQEL